MSKGRSGEAYLLRSRAWIISRCFSLKAWASADSSLLLLLFSLGSSSFSPVMLSLLFPGSVTVFLVALICAAFLGKPGSDNGRSVLMASFRISCNLFVIFRTTFTNRARACETGNCNSFYNRRCKDNTRLYELCKNDLPQFPQPFSFVDQGQGELNFGQHLNEPQAQDVSRSIKLQQSVVNQV